MKSSVVTLLLVAAAAALTYQFVDIPVARFIADVLSSDVRLARRTAHIPDLLLPSVLLISAASWSGYFHLRVKGRLDKHCRLFQLIGTALPIAFIAKTVLKHFFGRVNTRAWLHDSGLYGFHWLHGGGNFNGFPSGHMAVFTPLILALNHYYPEYRWLWMALLVLLAFALIATDYHYVTDVIGGAYIGFLVHQVTRRGLKWWNTQRK